MIDLLADIWPELAWDIDETPSGTRAIAPIDELHIYVTAVLTEWGHKVYATPYRSDGSALWAEAAGSLEASLRAAKARIADRRARLGQCPQT